MHTVDNFDKYYKKVQKLVTDSKDDTQLFQAAVDAPFHNKLFSTHFDLGIMVLLLVNKDTNLVERITFSNTEAANHAIKASAKPFHEILIPLNNSENISAKAIKKGRPYQTSDWRYLFVPALNAEAARFNQAEAGMGCSVVYPLIGARNGGALVFSFFQTIDMIGKAHHDFMKQYSTFVAQQLKK